jgi:glycine cleavage system regulatory protein
MAALILTVIGPDRPGLVRALSEAVAARGGSWLESRMARLAGQFAGIVLVDAPESLREDLRALEGQGLRITVQGAGAGPAVAGPGGAGPGGPGPGGAGPGGAGPGGPGPDGAGPDGAAESRLEPRLALEVVGNDRPGIVRDIARILAESGVNIEELTTGVASGSFSGEALFRVTAVVRAPNGLAMDTARAGLERLGNELMVDIQPAPKG